MSRSKKTPIIVMSKKIDKNFAHRRVRRRVHVELTKSEPDPTILEATPRTLGDEEWGTKIDFRFVDPDEDDNFWGTGYLSKLDRK